MLNFDFEIFVVEIVKLENYRLVGWDLELLRDTSCELTVLRG